MFLRPVSDSGFFFCVFLKTYSRRRAATRGQFLGGWFTGGEFSNSPSELMFVVDGKDVLIKLAHNLTTIDQAKSFLNQALGNNVTVTDIASH